ncbi:MAG: cytochrome [Ilumatobacteraceae bacterium]|nr:cytochrome [Ilumatobacteraceae bacterium]
MTDVDAINFFRDDAMIADPYPYYEALRAECPVRREPHHDVVMVPGYEEATLVLNDTATFSSCTSVTGPFPGFPVSTDGVDDISDLIAEHRDSLPMSDQLPTLDPPKHTDHRGLLMRLITPKRLKENESFMWGLADRQMATFLGSGTCEFIGDFASPFAMLVIADLLGVPEDEHAQFEEALLHRPHGGGVGSTSARPMAHSPLDYLYERFSEYIEDRRLAPREDVLTGLASATFPDGSIPEVIDVVRVAANLFAAGQETTVRLLGSAVQLIAEDQELQALLRTRRDLVPNFIEECLRIESPIKGDFRLSKVATTDGGLDIPAGTTLMLLMAAANRDPRRFEDPATFDVNRANARQHISFGRGPHTCPGAPLARAEARVSIERLLDQTSAIRISDSEHGPAGSRRFSYVPTFILRGLTRLHLELTPSDAA